MRRCSAPSLRLASAQDQRSRQRNELWQRRLAAVGVPLQIEIAPFGELTWRALAGQLTMWGYSYRLPDGPERLAVIAEANRRLLAYVPYIARYHTITTTLTQPWVQGYRPRPFASDWWRSAEVVEP